MHALRETSAPLAPSCSATDPTEHTTALADGTELFYRAWLPARPTARALILLHRGHEHSGRLVELVRALDLEDVAVFAWDARGHGRSGGERGAAPSFGALVADLDAFAHHVCSAHGASLEETVVLGHSVGAVVAAAWVHDYAPPVRGLALATPALRVRLYVPFARAGLRLLRTVARGRRLFVRSYVRGRMLTSDKTAAAEYDADPLVSRAIGVDVLLGLYEAAERITADAATIAVPTLVMAGGSDLVVDLGAERRFFERLGSPSKRWRLFPRMRHDILHEADRALVVDEIRRFVREAFDGPAGTPSELGADERGATKEEFERLSRPLAPSPRRASFAIQRRFLETVGRLSDGIRLGWETGFDSGRSLDYVYENRAGGRLGVGRLVDRVYLDSPGWRGIRQRRANVRALLHEAIRRSLDERGAAHVLDVAAGCGRYAFDVLAELRDRRVTATLCDLDGRNLRAARERAEILAIHGVGCRRLDAFDADAVVEAAPGASVAVVSGLYELFPDNAMVLRSLSGVARAVGAGGYLVYTGQPWHPQLEMIARVLTNREGRPWVMRRRTQRELDELVGAAGFEKLETLVDDAGIFTVSLAVRRAE